MSTFLLFSDSRRAEYQRTRTAYTQRHRGDTAAHAHASHPRPTSSSLVSRCNCRPLSQLCWSSVAVSVWPSIHNHPRHLMLYQRSKLINQITAYTEYSSLSCSARQQNLQLQHLSPTTTHQHYPFYLRASLASNSLKSKHSHHRQWVFVIARAVSNSLTRIIRLHNSLPSDPPSNPPSDLTYALLTHPPGNHLPPHIPSNLSQPFPSAIPSDLNSDLKSDLNSALLTDLLCNLPRHLPKPLPRYLPSDLQHQHHHPHAHLTEPSRI